MTETEISDYLINNYEECRHNSEAMADAINETSENLDYENEWDLFHLLVENKPIPELHTHSYGFHTENGRNILKEIMSLYSDKITKELQNQ